jgi:hypothetical protein
MNNTCYPIEIVKSMYSMLNIHMISLNYYIDAKDYENPIKPSYVSNLNIGSTTGSRTDTYFFKNTDVKTDEGWILESFNKLSNVQFESSSNAIVPANPGDHIHWIIISIEDLRDVYTRKYLKLQDILASAGGFIKVCLLFFCFLNDYLQQNRIYQKMYLRVLDKAERITFKRNAPGYPNLKSESHTNNTPIQQIFSSANLINVRNTPTGIISEFRSSYKRLNICKSFFPFLFVKKSISMRVIRNFEISIRKLLSIETLLKNHCVNKKMNKEIWKDNTYQPMKFFGIVEFVRSLTNEHDDSRRSKHMFDATNKLLQPVRNIDVQKVIRNEVELMSIK